jgi:hypothetical protein
VQYVPLFIDIVITAEPIYLRVPLPIGGERWRRAARLDGDANERLRRAAAAGSTFRALDLHSRSGLRIAGLAVRVHYLFGPAPRELTYQRIISVNIGSVSGHVLPPQLLALGDGFAQLGMHFKDHDNTVTWDYFPQEVPYHTTVRVKIARVQLHVWGGASVVELLVQDGVHIAVDDLRRRTHDVSIDVHLVGGAGATCLVPKTAPAFALAADWRHWREVGRVCLPRIAITAALGPPVDAAATQWQIDYLTEQDRATSKRIWWLWSDVAPAGVMQHRAQRRRATPTPPPTRRTPHGNSDSRAPLDVVPLADVVEPAPRRAAAVVAPSARLKPPAERRSGRRRCAPCRRCRRSQVEPPIGKSQRVSRLTAVGRERLSGAGARRRAS